MMQRFLFFSVFLILAWSGYAQPPRERIMFSSAGAANNSVPISIGEPFIGTANTNITIGSQQNSSSTGVGVKQVQSQDNQVSIFPNPTNKELTISVNGKNQHDFYVHVYDVLGREMLAQKQANQQITLDIQHLPQGTYFVKICKADKQIILTQPVIKQ